jgi:hypothetical protein
MIAQSLPTTPPTLQEIFDTVVAHLRDQGVQCRNIFGCQYRGPDQTACAVGCLIPDSLYTFNIEGQNIYTLFNSNKIPEFFTAFGITYGNDPKLNLLTKFQSIHDNIEPIQWESRFSSLATNYSLAYEPR